MSDDATSKRVLSFLAKPPKNVNEMTEDEVAAWAEQLAEQMDPNAGRHTPVFDDVLELNAGTITIQQLGERWAARRWLPIHPELTDVDEIAALEACDTFGPDGSWSEVQRLFARGVLSREDFFAVGRAMEQAKSTYKGQRS